MSASLIDARIEIRSRTTTASMLSVDEGSCLASALKTYDATSAPDSVANTGPRGWLSLVSASRVRSAPSPRSEEHTSELQSLTNLVCRLLLEKKKQKTT